MKIALLIGTLAMAVTVTAQDKGPMPPGKVDNPLLIKMVDDLRALKDWQKMAAITKANRKQVIEMLKEDKLTTAVDFRRAATAVQDPMIWFDHVQMQYELSLTGALMGDDESAKAALGNWDFLMMSISRPRRLQEINGGMEIEFKPAPKVVRDALLNLGDARPKALAAKDLAELEQIRKDDQEARTGEMTQAKMEEMSRGDAKRMARVKEIVAEGLLKTGRDFHSAALIYQHGHGFEDYALAHELSLAAVLLGDNDAVWLVSRTYDRMLGSIGHRQRFATQWRQDGLSPMNNEGVNDRMRLQWGSSRLQPLLDREAETVKKLFGGG